MMMPAARAGAATATRQLGDVFGPLRDEVETSLVCIQ